MRRSFLNRPPRVVYLLKQRLASLPRDPQPGRAGYRVQKSPIITQPPFDAEFASGESRPLGDQPYELSPKIMDNTLPQGLTKVTAVAHSQTPPQEKGPDCEPWGYLRPSSITTTKGAHKQTLFFHNQPLDRASACPYHHPILPGQLPLAPVEQDLDPMQHFLDEGPSEQNARDNGRDTGELSVHKAASVSTLLLARSLLRMLSIRDSWKGHKQGPLESCWKGLGLEKRS